MNQVIIERLDAAQVEAALPALVEILQDAVDGGASVGFLAPLGREEAEEYWRSALAAVAAGTRILLVARNDNHIVGTVQLNPEQRANSRHRAEVMKLLVHRSARRLGIGRQLMVAIEGEARTLGRTLLMLDTKTGDDAERLYQSMGYQTLGIVPNFACDPDGTLRDCTYFYRHL